MSRVILEPLTEAVGVCSPAIAIVALLSGCGGSGSQRVVVARSVNTAAAPSPVAGSQLKAYPPADPATRATCPLASADRAYCVQGAGLRVQIVRQNDPCQVRVDPPGVKSGRWLALSSTARSIEFSCRAGAVGSRCAIAGRPGSPPTFGTWGAGGACLTQVRAGAPCAVNAASAGIWQRYPTGGTAHVEYRCVAHSASVDADAGE